MWFAWVLIAFFLIRVLFVQASVGVKPKCEPVKQGVANAATVINLALVAGIVAYFL